MYYEAPYALREISVRLSAAEADAARRLGDMAYERLLPRSRAGETSLTDVQLLWAWQSVELLDIESGCAAGRTLITCDRDAWIDEERHDSVPLPIWRWKLVWMLVGYGVHVAWSEFDDWGERVWKGICYHLHAPDDDEDFEFAKRRYERYVQFQEDLESGTRFWERLEGVIRAAVAEATPDVHRGSPWRLDPVPVPELRV